MRSARRAGRSCLARAMVVAVSLALVAVSGACTTESDTAADKTGSAGRSASSTEAVPTTTGEECRPAPTTVAAAPVPGSMSDFDVTSFDGTTIRAHWFPVEPVGEPRPTVLMGPGWGSAGDTNVDKVGVLGAINIKTLRDAGYNVLTWDPRGFGSSTGIAQVDSADYEGRDVQHLLSWVASRTEAATEVAGDPTVGMVGGSYGGGIQLITAAIDCRVDAIVPIIAWHSLGTSLYQSDTFKAGWADMLAKVAASARLDPMITEAYAQGNTTGTLTDEQIQWFLARGPGDMVADITAPTMVVGGTVDTLFPLDEDVTNYRMIRRSDVPVSMYWFCGGHGTCLTEPGDQQRMTTRVIAWLDRWVKDDKTVDTGPRFDFLDQDGTRYTGDDYPLPAGKPIVAKGSGTLELQSQGGSGPAVVPEARKDLLSGIAGNLIPSPAERAVDVDIPVASDAMIVGAPTLRLTYSGAEPTGAEDTAGRPTRVFAQLIDVDSGVVVGNQITPVPLDLDGATHDVEVPLEVVAHRVAAGSSLRLQIVAVTTLYGLPRLGGSVELSEVAVSLPTVKGFSRVEPG